MARCRLLLLPLLAGIGGLLTLPQRARAQVPRGEPGRFEVFGLDWPRSSAWRRRARLVREQRWILLRAGDVGSLNRAPLLAPGLQQGAAPSATAVTGTFYVPVVPIVFPDAGLPFPISGAGDGQDYQDVLFGGTPPLGRPYTVKTFYEELSGGRIQMSGRILAPVTTDSTAAYYEHDCNGIGVITACADGGRRFGLMLLAALDSISNRPGGDTVWSQFDNDGPDGLPNSGDDDGDVDFVTFLQPKKDGACQPSSGIWAHRYVINAWNNGSKYVTKTPRRDAQGQPIAGQFIKVDNYTMQSAVGGVTSCDPSFIMAIGTVAHETGHAFGLPDLYDTDRSSGTEGIGEWGLMGSGNYTTPFSPSGYDAWSLNELGWVKVDTLNASRMVTTGPRQLTDTIFFARTSQPTQFLLLENRQRFESDTALLNLANGQLCPPLHARCQKDPGLLLWHIDQLLIDARRDNNRINTGPLQGVALVQADGLNNLRSTGTLKNRGDRGDPYPGSTGNPRFSLVTSPAARTNQGQYLGFVIDQIQQLPNGVLRFRFTRREPTVVRASSARASVRVNGLSLPRFEDAIPQGDQFTIAVDPFQDLGDTRLQFIAWSNAGAQTQTLVSGIKPDTLTATFAADYRLLVSGTSGQGTVSASRPGDLAGGIFLAEGTGVTLTATPAGGWTFARWQGDTVATSPVLALTISRPFALAATFIPTVDVSVADATAEILGTPKLSLPQKDFLDQLGNHNGLYDLGDFLALKGRSGPAAGPELARRTWRTGLERRP